MTGRRIPAALSLLLVAAAPGCYYFAAQESLSAAESAFESAKSQGLEQSSPYHYYSAEQYLERAKIENRESDFASAHQFAMQAEAHAQSSSAAAAPAPAALAPSSAGDLEVTPIAPAAPATDTAAPPPQNLREPEFVVQPEPESGGE